MNKDKNMELMDVACNDYAEAMEIIDEMKPFFIRCDAKADVVKTKMQFDIILQGVLVKLAVADGIFTAVEENFVASIVDHYDLLHLINDRHEDKYYTWQSIENLGKDDIKEFLTYVDEEIKDFLDDFVKPLSYVDALTERNYLDEITTCISGIALALIQSDGRITEKETEEARKAIYDLFYARFAYFKNLVKID